VSSNIEPELEERDDVIITQMFWRSIAIFAIVLAVSAVGGGIWVYSHAKPARLDVKQVSKAPEDRTVGVAVPDLPFANITTHAGLTFKHANGAAGQKLLPETMGSGCAFLDFDNDGDQDLLFVNSCSWPWDKVLQGPAPTMELYRNNGQGGFENVTADAGLGVTFYGMGVACGDYDADGWTDVFITAVGKNHLFRNVQGKFVETTDEAQVGGDAQEWSTSAAFFDFDNDGDLDLFVGNYVRWSREIDAVQGFKIDGGIRAYGPPTAFAGTYPYLYRNDGKGKFKDVSAEAGIQVKNPNRDVPMPVAKTMGVMPFDIDGDGWLDLVLSNDTVQNFAFVNQRNGTFQEVGIHCGVAFDSSGNARGAMGLDMAFFRNDNSLGLAIGNFANEMTALYVSQYKSMLFTDDAIATGLGPPTRQELKFGIFFFDCDLDGRLDLLSANGHLEQEINKVQKSQHYEQPPHLLWNAGSDAKSEFVSVPPEKCGAEFMKPMVGRGSAYADIDGDGDLDVILTANGGVPRLLRNDQKSGHHWLRVKLVGKGANREALGAVVKLKAGNIEQTRVVMATRSYMSSSELPVTFGLGKETTVDSLHITWPNGKMQAVKVDKVDQLLKIEQE
jgi:hypothetical protein